MKGRYLWKANDDMPILAIDDTMHDTIDACWRRWNMALEQYLLQEENTAPSLNTKSQSKICTVHCCFQREVRGIYTSSASC